MPEKLSIRPLIISVLCAGLALAVLYVILRAPVHAPKPPNSLPFLVLATSPKAVPSVAFSDAAGRRHALSEFRGRTVLLNLWAPWCVPCLRELPALVRLSKALPPPKLTVIAVDVGRGGPADARSFLAEHGAAVLPVYVDSDIALVRAFGAYGLPLTVMIDPSGREIARSVGAGAWDAPDAVAYLKQLALASGGNR
jgi:thiol-disulfide isomerase/thioredoxin